MHVTNKDSIITVTSHLLSLALLLSVLSLLLMQFYTFDRKTVRRK